MNFTLVSPARRTMVALIATFVVAVGVYETRMLDSGYGAWLDMLGNEEGQPSPGAHLAFDATAYCKGVTTTSGVAPQTGVAAADPQLLPVGSVVEIDSIEARYNGIYTIMDTGPKVQGRLVDIYMWSCHEALKFGRRPVRLVVLRLGWNPRASRRAVMDRVLMPQEPEPGPARPVATPSVSSGSGEQ